ncbi:unnamed protein product [Moneuplotes crassus]|uniref:Uncharacterized protein n=1 Tax=Euplotes crassus TaxID=5936 RepID=A0AAD1XRI3_EUPCR|nr:unnamed protein product [Moneuplotes crassus]
MTVTLLTRSLFLITKKLSKKRTLKMDREKLQGSIMGNSKFAAARMDTEMEKIWNDPLNYGKPPPKIFKFKTKYTDEEVYPKDLPPTQKYVRLNLEDKEYMKLFMQNNPVHDNDREKASSIAHNISYNQEVVDTNPYFGHMKIHENEIYLSKKEMYSMGQYSEEKIHENPYTSQVKIHALLKKWKAKKLNSDYTGSFLDLNLMEQDSESRVSRRSLAKKRRNAPKWSSSKNIILADDTTNNIIERNNEDLRTLPVYRKEQEVKLPQDPSDFEQVLVKMKRRDLNSTTQPKIENDKQGLFKEGPGNEFILNPKETQAVDPTRADTVTSTSKIDPSDSLFDSFTNVMGQDFRGFQEEKLKKYLKEAFCENGKSQFFKSSCKN